MKPNSLGCTPFLIRGFLEMVSGCSLRDKLRIVGLLICKGCLSEP
jgi:hypothetical protein